MHANVANLVYGDSGREAFGKVLESLALGGVSVGSVDFTPVEGRGSCCSGGVLSSVPFSSCCHGQRNVIVPARALSKARVALAVASSVAFFAFSNASSVFPQSLLLSKYSRWVCEIWLTKSKWQSYITQDLRPGMGPGKHQTHATHQQVKTLTSRFQMTPKHLNLI